MNYPSGFQTITDELGKGNERFHILQLIFPNLSADEESKSVDSLTRIYHNYKREYVKHLSFNPGTENLSKYISMTLLGYLFSATIIEHSPLEAVYIFFDTATYDEIERDEKVMLEGHVCDFFLQKSIGINLKVTIEAQLGLIGGTMGLLTGFSILSGVEIVYFLLRFLLNFFDNIPFARFLLSLKINRVFCRQQKS